MRIRVQWQVVLNAVIDSRLSRKWGNYLTNKATTSFSKCVFYEVYYVKDNELHDWLTLQNFEGDVF